MLKGDGLVKVQQRLAGVAKADAKDQANPSRQGQRTDLVDNNNAVIHEVARPSGTSRAQALRRLRKDRPDIHKRVLTGELSPHAGMIEAGFRKVRRKTTPIEQALKRLVKMNVEDRKIIWQKLNQEFGAGGTR
jgi:hypothetical protein